MWAVGTFAVLCGVTQFVLFTWPLWRGDKS